MITFVTLPEAIALWCLFGLGFIVIPLVVIEAVLAFIKAWRDAP